MRKNCKKIQKAYFEAGSDIVLTNTFGANGVKYHDAKTSFLEGVIARGDRRLSEVIYTAWKNGCKFDAWDEHFKYDTWIESFNNCSIDPSFYANRKREFEEIMPWDHIDFGVSKQFLIKEDEKAYQATTTPHCRKQCSGCSANKLIGGPCFG